MYYTCDSMYIYIVMIYIYIILKHFDTNKCSAHRLCTTYNCFSPLRTGRVDLSVLFEPPVDARSSVNPKRRCAVCTTRDHSAVSLHETRRSRDWHHTAYMFLTSPIIPWEKSYMQWLLGFGKLSTFRGGLSQYARFLFFWVARWIEPQEMERWKASIFYDVLCTLSMFIPKYLKNTKVSGTSISL